MHQLIQQHQAEIADVCRRYRVQQLDVFGSAARGQDFDPQRSDVDFLVEFQPGPNTGYARTYFEFQEALEQLVGRWSWSPSRRSETRISGPPYRRVASGSMDRDPRELRRDTRPLP